MTIEQNKKEQNKKKLKNFVRTTLVRIVDEFTRLGQAFLPTSRGAELPLSPRKK